MQSPPCGGPEKAETLPAKSVATVCHQKARRRSSDSTQAFPRNPEGAPTVVGCGWHCPNPFEEDARHVCGVCLIKPFGLQPLKTMRE